jgi:acetyl-CoA carboxylase biotin carboxyl carrier protein
MDYKQIQELIKLINKSNIGEVSIEENDFKITIKQKKEQAVQQQPVAAPVFLQPQVAATPQPLPPPPQPTQVKETSTTSVETSAAKQENLITIKSPMIGTFYKRPSPDKPSFVEPGDDITPGQVLCIIEAMKLFNEIESEVSGKVVKILVDDSSPVEYDQPLFLVEPS